MSKDGPFTADDVAAIYSKYTLAEINKFNRILSPFAAADRNLRATLTASEEIRFQSYEEDQKIIRSHPNANQAYTQREAFTQGLKRYGNALFGFDNQPSSDALRASLAKALEGLSSQPDISWGGPASQACGTELSSQNHASTHSDPNGDLQQFAKNRK